MAAISDKPSLLLVEDDSSTQAALIRLLRDRFQLRACASSSEARKYFDDGFSPDIIISDYALPEESGLEFLNYTKTNHPDSVRVLLTGHLVSAELSQALQNGILHRIFLKPWENDVLLLQIQEVLQQRELLKNTRALEKMSTTDGLTGLFNQRFFQDSLTKELERAIRHQRAISLMVLDLDQFKSINDEHGHGSGNKALSLVAEVIKATLRHIDICARVGGDEFAIILPDTLAETAKEVAERLRTSVEKKAQVQNMTLTISIGVGGFLPSGPADFSRDSENPNTLSRLKADQLFDLADKALYQAKKNGKNQTVVAVASV